MKWFFALNEACPTFSYYADMVKVAVHTAFKHTSLTPHLLYDGQENALTDWLRERKVPVIYCRTSLYDKLHALSERKNDAQILTIGAGVFLRTELPAIALKTGLDDTYVLYTDCDVMFMHEVTTELQKLVCRYFAVGPESDPKDYQRMNTGVMLMNLKNLGAMDKKFRKFLSSNLGEFPCWDQSAYQWFYRGPRSFFRRNGWDRLPIEFNWKSYWPGDYSRAKIIHFHGPKPFQRDQVRSGKAPQILQDLAKDSYYELCTLWNKMLEEAN